MKLRSVEIVNFRSCEHVSMTFDDYTCLVGPNGAGKSAIIHALNVFFREPDVFGTHPGYLVAEDFHKRHTTDPITIIVTFDDLDDAAKQDFRDYVRHDRLVISVVALFDGATSRAEVKQYGQRLAMPAFKQFFRDLDNGTKVGDLRNIYGSLRRLHTELPAVSTKDDMAEALRTYERDHVEGCELIPSEDQFYGISRGANRLARYVQWVFVPAVKDASSEQIETRNCALGKLLARTVRAKINFDERLTSLRDQAQAGYQALLDENQVSLQELSAALQARLVEWSHPEASISLHWAQDPEKSVRIEEPLAHAIAGEHDFQGELCRFGHGFQRSYLLALLQELATNEMGRSDESVPRLVLGCEEPELYQHPPQARHLAEVMQVLSAANSQIVVSTHSPVFVSGEAFEHVRMVRKTDASHCTVVKAASYQDIATEYARVTDGPPRKPEAMLARVHQLLQPQLNEMFFTNRLILVEGLEDVAYITTYMNLLDLWKKYRAAGCHLVPTGGKSQMIQPLIISRTLDVSTFIVFDSDADEADKNGSRIKHERDNRALLRICGYAQADPMSSHTLWETGLVMWHSDIGSVVQSEIGKADWEQYSAQADALYGHIGGLKKNVLHIAAALAFAWNAGKRSASLEKLCNAIIGFGGRPLQEPRALRD